jgi:methylenetetrahydrofolate dehydrogenase (NADP+)/methenyltetrahydrofolate cyclohydrolase
MTAQLIDGKALAAQIRSELKDEVAQMRVQPCLAVIIVGDDPASHVYVRNKGKAAEGCGIKSFTDVMPADTTQEALLARVEELNADESVHGILVQLPLPPQIDANRVINTITPEKDVDGFHVVNAGRLATGQDSLVACTPQGCLVMLQHISPLPMGEVAEQGDAGEGSLTPAQHPHPKSKISTSPHGRGNLAGQHAVVIGKSNIVGRPMAQLLLNEGCTVTVCHSKTKDVAEECRRADIIVAAVGRPKMVKADWIKPGATVIDVGINRTDDGKLVGDVDFDGAKEVASAITPVPGGVGPMTIACLLKNTVKAAKLA